MPAAHPPAVATASLAEPAATKPADAVATASVGALEQQLRNPFSGIARRADGRPLEPCPWCEKSFRSIDYLHAHMRRQHPESMGRHERETAKGDVACALARFARRRIMSRGPSHELSADRDVMLAAVRFDATLLKYAATALRADREMMLAAVQQDASLIKYAATALRADRAFILAAVQQDASFLRNASAQLRADRELRLSC